MAVRNIQHFYIYCTRDRAPYFHMRVFLHWKLSYALKSLVKRLAYNISLCLLRYQKCSIEFFEVERVLLNPSLIVFQSRKCIYITTPRVSFIQLFVCYTRKIWLPFWLSLLELYLLYLIRQKNSRKPSEPFKSKIFILREFTR